MLSWEKKEQDRTGYAASNSHFKMILALEGPTQ
jgi:hypothetical protein